MTYPLPGWLVIGVELFIVAASTHAFAAEDPLLDLPDEAAFCSPCGSQGTNRDRCSDLYKGSGPDYQGYQGFARSMKDRRVTYPLLTLRNWVDPPAGREPAGSCGACLPAALALKLMTQESSSPDSETLEYICGAAEKVIEPCEKLNPGVFKSLMTRYQGSLSRAQGSRIPTKCKQLPSWIQSSQSEPTPKGLSPRTKLLLGLGVPMTTLGLALLVGTVFTATSVAAPIGATTGCAYKGFDTPCFDPGPAIGLGISGGVLTVGGMVLIGLGSHRAIAERGSPATVTAKEKP